MLKYPLYPYSFLNSPPGALTAAAANIEVHTMMHMIENKNIVLTGASSGIGLEILKILKDGRGNRILAVSRHTESLEGFAPNVIPFSCDVSSAGGVDAIFARAEELFGKIDVFYANAGFPYFEEFNYADWDRIEKIFNTNTLSPIYTYSKYIRHLNGREGTLAYTISAMGKMAMPGYALYTATKFAMTGFQEAIRLEKPDNLHISCVYPVATSTNFFKVGAGADVKVRKPFPVQRACTVAKAAVRGITKGKEQISPCCLFEVSQFLMGHIPPVRTLYWNLEKAKFVEFLNAKKGKCKERS